MSRIQRTTAGGSTSKGLKPSEHTEAAFTEGKNTWAPAAKFSFYRIEATKEITLKGIAPPAAGERTEITVVNIGSFTINFEGNSIVSEGPISLNTQLTTLPLIPHGTVTFIWDATTLNWRDIGAEGYVPIKGKHGAVLTRLGHEKFPESEWAVGWVNVVSFGADPTGKERCDTALKEAFEVSKAVLIPEGTFLFEEQHKIENCTIVGSGTQTTTLLIGGKSSNLFLCEGENSCTLENFTIEQKETPTSGAFIVIKRSNNRSHHFKDLELRFGWILMEFFECAACYSTGILFWKHAHRGVVMKAPNGFVQSTGDIWFTNCNFFLTPTPKEEGLNTANIEIHGIVAACGFVNCDIVGAENPMLAEGEGEEVRTEQPGFCYFTNCYFDSAHGAVTLNKTKGFRFTQCWFANRPGAGCVVERSIFTTFTNCKFMACGEMGLAIRQKSNFTKVTDATFDGNGETLAYKGGLISAHMTLENQVSDFIINGCSFSNILGAAAGGLKFGILIEKGAAVGGNFKSLVAKPKEALEGESAHGLIEHQAVVISGLKGGKGVYPAELINNIVYFAQNVEGTKLTLVRNPLNLIQATWTEEVTNCTITPTSDRFVIEACTGEGLGANGVLVEDRSEGEYKVVNNVPDYFTVRNKVFSTQSKALEEFVQTRWRKEQGVAQLRGVFRVRGIFKIKGKITKEGTPKTIKGLKEAKLRLLVGEKVEGSGIPAGTTVESIISESEITITENATETAEVELTFTPALNTNRIRGGSEKLKVKIESTSKVVKLAAGNTNNLEAFGTIVSGSGAPATSPGNKIEKIINETEFEVKGSVSKTEETEWTFVTKGEICRMGASEKGKQGVPSLERHVFVLVGPENESEATPKLFVVDIEGYLRSTAEIKEKELLYLDSLFYTVSF